MKVQNWWMSTTKILKRLLGGTSTIGCQWTTSYGFQLQNCCWLCKEMICETIDDSACPHKSTGFVVAGF